MLARDARRLRNVALRSLKHEHEVISFKPGDHFTLRILKRPVHVRPIGVLAERRWILHERQVRRRDGSAKLLTREIAHAILQLADIARPVITKKANPGLIRKRDRRQPILSRITFDERQQQDADVVRPFAQRRDRDRHHEQPMKEVAAKRGAFPQRIDLQVGRGNETHVDAPNPRLTEPAILLLLQQAQQLHLCGGRQRVDLIEKQRAPLRGGDQAFGRLLRSGEGACLMAEQLVFEEMIRHRAAIDWHKRPRAARAALVDVASVKFLADSGGADDQDLDIDARHFGNGVQQFQVGSTLPDQSESFGFFRDEAMRTLKRSMRIGRHGSS